MAQGTVVRRAAAAGRGEPDEDEDDDDTALLIQHPPLSQRRVRLARRQKAFGYCPPGCQVAMLTFVGPGMMVMLADTDPG